MALIDDTDAAEIRERLDGMTGAVNLIHFTQESNLEYGLEARQILEELTQFSEKLTLETYNFVSDTQKVAQYAVDKVPATVIRNGKDYGIRFFGLPAGYEFATLLDAIVVVSNGNSGLKPASREKLALLSKPLHLQVF